MAAEIEAEYMWGKLTYNFIIFWTDSFEILGLLHPSLLSGEGGYYLTTLSSAVHVLKNFKESKEENIKNMKTDVSGVC